MLNQRGETARIAKKAAYIRSELGRLEEKMAHLSREWPHGMAKYLDVKPSSFPFKSVSRISHISKSFAQESPYRTLFNAMDRLWKCAMLIPWYLHAKKRLKVIPGAPNLHAWPTPQRLQSLYGDLVILENASTLFPSTYDVWTIGG